MKGWLRGCVDGIYTRGCVASKMYEMGCESGMLLGLILTLDSSFHGSDLGIKDRQWSDVNSGCMKTGTV